jgi:hypothetical protein
MFLSRTLSPCFKTEFLTFKSYLVLCLLLALSAAQIRKTVNPGKCKISDMIHNKEPIAKTVETKADHVSRNQLSYESDSDDDIVTHVVPTRHKIYHLSDCQPHHLPHSHL